MTINMMCFLTTDCTLFFGSIDNFHRLLLIVVRRRPVVKGCHSITVSRLRISRCQLSAIVVPNDHSASAPRSSVSLDYWR